MTAITVVYTITAFIGLGLLGWVAYDEFLGKNRKVK